VVHLFTRREVLQIGTAGVFALVNAPFGVAASAVVAKDALDHVLLGCPDLDAGIRWFEERTGTNACYGGVHPGRGTRNALASLGGRHYLEIIAPDPQQPDSKDDRAQQLRSLTAPRLVGWAMASHDLNALKRQAETAGFKTIAGPPGSRARPDGKVLHWRTLALETATPLVPFAIEWSANSPHPSQDAPPAGTIAQLIFETPQPEPLRTALRALGVLADMRRAAQPAMRLKLTTKKGVVDL